MMKRKDAWPLLLLAILLLGGCVSWRIVGVRAGMTSQEAASIMQRCRAFMATPAADPFVAIYMQHVAMQNVRACLEAHGIETADQ
jgi:hypothetical protein